MQKMSYSARRAEQASSNVASPMPNANPNAYWSPASQVSQSSSYLNGNAPSYSIPQPQPASDASMNLAAVEFVPHGAPNQSSKDNELIPEEDELYFHHDENEQQQNDIDWTIGTNHTQCVTTPQCRPPPALQMNSNLRQHLHAQALELLQCLDPKDARYKEIPPQYHSIYPLDHSAKSRSATGSFGYPSTVFKVVQDGVSYALRRIDNVRTSARVVQSAMDQWSKFRHPNIVSLEQCFIHHRSVYFQYAYWPTAQTLSDRFIGARQPAPEALLWSYLCQLCTAVRQVHGSGSALRCLQASHVIATGGNKVRVSGVGIMDVLEHEQAITLNAKQREDIVSLGTCLLTVACRCFVTNQNRQQCIAALHIYSSEFQILISTLLFNPPDVFTLCASIASHLADELSMAYAIADGLETHLSCEFNNGRLLKLLLKLDHVCNDSWEDTGDRYMLKLFRNYLFRQMNDQAQQVVDMGHVVHSLNRLDMGDESQLLLASPDESTVLVVTFADLKLCIQNAFAELAVSAEGAYADGLGQQMSVLEISHAPFVTHQSATNESSAPRTAMDPSSAGFVPRAHSLNTNPSAGNSRGNSGGKNRSGGKGRRGGRRNH